MSILNNSLTQNALGAVARNCSSSCGVTAAALIAAQVTFVMFLSAGHFKGNPSLAWIPFDLTLAATALVLVFSLLSFLGRRGRFRIEVVWVLLFFAVMILTVLWTDWTPYALELATRFFTLTLLAAVLPAFILTETRAVQRFVSLIVVVGIVLSTGVMIQLAKGGFTGDSGERTAGFATVTIALGWDAGMALVGLYASALRGKKSIWLSLFCLPLLFLAIVASGSRGPLFVLLGVMAFLTLRFSLPSKRSIGIALLLLACTGLAVSRYSSLLPQGSVQRIVSYLEGRYDESAEERVLMRQAALESIERNPFGIGFGGFGRVFNFRADTDIPPRAHPHNIILEIALESGIPAAVLFVGLLAVALRNSYRAAVAAPEMQPFFAIFLFVLGTAFSSGDLNEQRIMWTLLTIGLQLPLPDVQAPGGHPLRHTKEPWKTVFVG